jgi:hypothetical protein
MIRAATLACLILFGLFLGMAGSHGLVYWLIVGSLFRSWLTAAESEGST